MNTIVEFETDFKGIKGALPPSGEWRTIHRGIVRRPFEIEIKLPDGSATGDYDGRLEARWKNSGGRWELQMLNRAPASLFFHLKWYIPASERLCCHDYGRSE